MWRVRRTGTRPIPSVCEADRRADLLHTIVVTLLVATGGYFGFVAIAVPALRPMQGYPAAFFALLLGVLLLIKRRQTKLATYLLFGSTFTFITLSALATTDSHGSTASLYVGLVLVAGLLAGGRGALTGAGISAFALLAVTLHDIADADATTRIVLAPEVGWVIDAVVLLGCSALLYIASGTYKRALGRADELTERTLEISRLAEMTSLLQSCVQVTEAYRTVARALRSQFPDSRGALLLVQSGRGQLEIVSGWGDVDVESGPYSTRDCWALRRGRLHHVVPGDEGPRCAHVSGSRRDELLCVPMLAQGEALGVLHLAYRDGGTRLSETQLRFVETVADQLGLALSHLRLQENLRSQAIRDPLTGLFNRRYMEETLVRELHRAERRRAPLSLIMADLDHFKEVNDSHGHEAGDAVLRAVGRELLRWLRAEDVACRYGGDEILLILPEATLHETVERAQVLRSKLRALVVEHGGQHFHGVRLSMGIASYPDDGTHWQALIRAADAGLYRAKDAGRDCIVEASSYEPMRIVR